MEEKKQASVLVIEDDRDVNEFICAALSTGGYAPVASYTGEDGLEKAVAERPDIILLDIRLPKIDGIEVCRTLSGDEHTKTIPIIMVSEKKDPSTKIESYVAGAKRYVTKPFAVGELLDIIDKTLSKNAIFVEKVHKDPTGN